MYYPKEYPLVTETLSLREQEALLLARLMDQVLNDPKRRNSLCDVMVIKNRIRDISQELECCTEADSGVPEETPYEDQSYFSRENLPRTAAWIWRQTANQADFEIYAQSSPERTEFYVRPINVSYDFANAIVANRYSYAPRGLDEMHAVCLKALEWRQGVRYEALEILVNKATCNYVRDYSAFPSCSFAELIDLFSSPGIKPEQLSLLFQRMKVQAPDGQIYSANHHFHE